MVSPRCAETILLDADTLRFWRFDIESLAADVDPPPAPNELVCVRVRAVPLIAGVPLSVGDVLAGCGRRGEIYS